MIYLSLKNEMRLTQNIFLESKPLFYIRQFCVSEDDKVENVHIALLVFAFLFIIYPPQIFDACDVL